MHYDNISFAHILSSICRLTEVPLLCTVHTFVSPLSTTGCECIMILFPCAHIFSLFYLQVTNTAPTPVLRCALAFVQIQFVSSSCMYSLFQCSLVSACVSKSSLSMCSSVSKQILIVSIVSFFCFVVTLLDYHSLETFREIVVETFKKMHQVWKVKWYWDNPVIMKSSLPQTPQTFHRAFSTGL